VVKWRGVGVPFAWNVSVTISGILAETERETTRPNKTLSLH